jgi:beta-glucuronidase
VDEFKDSFGFREIKTVGQELLLNRESVRLMGVEWMPGSNPNFGMAESEEEMVRILTQLKEVNCVFTRFHWQQSKKILDWCDRNGILVQEEIPHWQSPVEPDEGTMPVSIQHAEEMITRHYNHPSIYAWGMGNELFGQSEQTVKFMKDLKTHMRSLDQNRMVNYISNSLHYGPDKDATCVGDLLMWNEYIGTWQPSEDIHSDLQGAIDSIIAANPEMPLVISEFGFCEPAFKGGDLERENILIDKTNFYRKFPSIVGAIFFSLNDYRTQMGEEGEGKLRQRVHGSTDLFGVPKPSFQSLREISSPVVLENVLRESDSISCQLSVRDDIPSYSISGYRMIISSDEIENWEMTIEIPPLLPGEKSHISIPGINETAKTVNISVVRPTGFSVLNQQMKIEKKLLI